MVTGVSTFPRHGFIRLPIAHAAAGARDIAVDGVGQANLDSATLHAAGGVWSPSTVARIDSPSDSPDNEGVRGAQSVLPTENERQGGLAVWAPSIVPPIGTELSDEQKMACTFRILAHEGFSEHIAGHITWQRDGHDTLLVNPWGLWWNEIAASDVCTVDMDANVVAGKWDVTPAIHIHTELHRRRRDARVVIHNHPYSVCIMASLGRLPELLHQTGTMYDEDMVLISEYGGEIDSRALGADLADRIGTASVIILGNHGAIVTGSTIEEATFRAAALDRACRLAYDVLVTGMSPLTIPRNVIPGIKASLIERGSDVYFAGAVRQLLRREPEVLL